MERFYQLLEALPDGVLVVDRHGTIVAANEAAHALFRYDRGDLAGLPIGALVPERMRDRHHGHFERYSQSPTRRPMGSSLALYGRRGDGSEFRCDIALIPLDPALGEGVIASVRDIGRLVELLSKTEELERRVEHRTAALQAANAELIKARETAESANDAKTTFLANMSHEIRTPMTGILGLTHLLSQTRLDRRQQDYLAKIRVSAHSLLEIINDILDISKIEAGGIVLQHVPFLLEDVLTRISNIVSLKAHKKGLELVFRVESNVPERLVGDSLRLGQILLNFLDNAVKFTESGEVVLTIDCVAEAGDSVTLRFTVRDTGIGMRQSDLDSVFEPFIQADGSISRTHGGTGLGLPIAKRLIALMGGDLHVDARLGEGCTFTFEVPFSRASERSARARAESYEITGKRALVVDDVRSTRETLASYLEDFSMEVRTTSNIETALRIIAEAQRDHRPYDLVLLDFSTPGVNGREIVARVRDASPVDTPRIIATLTSFDMETLAREARQARVAGVLVKPVSQSALFDSVLHALIGGRETPTHAVSASPSLPIADRGGRILLVEDHPINQEVAQAILASFGLESVIAPNGRAAVELCRREDFDVDVVLMDLHMPVLNGYDAARELRLIPHRASLPVLAMTADAMPGTAERCAEAGMNGYITKPIDPALLLGALERFISFSGPTREVREVDLPVIEGIDVAGAIDRLDGDLELYRDLLSTFSGQHDALAHKGRAALEADDLIELRSLAHTVSGGASSLGMNDLARAATAVERAALAAEREVLPEMLDALLDEHGRVLASIANYLAAEPPA